MLKVSVSTISETKIFPPVNVAGKSSKRATAASIMTSSDSWWKYGSVALLEEKVKSSRIANDRIFWVMRPPWVKEVRMKKSMKNILNFSQSPGAFLSELSSESDPIFFGISPSRDKDTWLRAEPMSNRGLTDDGEDIFAVDFFLKKMKTAPTRTNTAHRATAYKMLKVDSGWCR